MPVRQFTDTSAVAISYTRANVKDRAEFDALSAAQREMRYVPYTAENHTVGLDSTKSAAITSSRRSNGSKNTRGTASAGWTSEVGFTQFIRDMLEMSFMDDFKTIGDGVELLIDGSKNQFMVSEERITNNDARNFRLFLGQLVNEMTLTFGDSNMGTLQIATVAANFDHWMNKEKSEDKAFGGAGSKYLEPDAYEQADSANNIKNLFIAKQDGTPVEMTFSQITATLGNNVRTQNAVGHIFAAGLAKGQSDVSFSGTAYYEDDTLLSMHMANEKLRLAMPIETKEGTIVLFAPSLSMSSPGGNSGGQNQDFTASITLTAETGSVKVNGAATSCLIGALWVQKGKDWKQYVDLGIQGLPVTVKSTQDTGSNTGSTTTGGTNQNGG